MYTSCISDAYLTDMCVRMRDKNKKSIIFKPSESTYLFLWNVYSNLPFSHQKHRQYANASLTV